MCIKVNSMAILWRHVHFVVNQPRKRLGKKASARFARARLQKCSKMNSKGNRRNEKIRCRRVNLFEKISWRDSGKEDKDPNSPARWDDYQLDQ
jgi:hypothetical protein